MSNSHHAADGLDDDLGDDGHQDKGYGIGGGVADHGGLGVRLAGDGSQGRGGGHAAADAAQAFQNVHLEDFHAHEVTGEHAGAGDDDAHDEDGRAVGGYRIHQVRSTLDAGVSQEENQPQILQKKAGGAWDIADDGAQPSEVAEQQGDDEGASRNTQGDSRAVAEAEVDQAKNDAQGEAEAQGKQVRLVHVLAAVADFVPVFGKVFRGPHHGQHVVAFQRGFPRGDEGEAQAGNAGDNDAVRTQGFQVAELVPGIVLVCQNQFAALLLGVHGVGIVAYFPQKGDVVGHGVAVAYDEDFRSFPERVFRSQGHQPVVANHAGDHAVQAVQQLAVRNVLAYQVGLCDADKAGNDADLLPGMHGFGLFVEVKAQQARQKLDEKDHAHHAERIGDTVTDANAASGGSRQAFRGGRQRRSAGACAGKDAGRDSRGNFEPDAEKASE